MLTSDDDDSFVRRSEEENSQHQEHQQQHWIRDESILETGSILIHSGPQDINGLGRFLHQSVILIVDAQPYKTVGFLLNRRIINSSISTGLVLAVMIVMVMVLLFIVGATNTRFIRPILGSMCQLNNKTKTNNTRQMMTAAFPYYLAKVSLNSMDDCAGGGCWLLL